MALVPTSGTNIRLLSGVPFQHDYKNTRWFDTVTQQTNYFANKEMVYSADQHNFQRIEGKTFISVQQPIDRLWNVNYLMFQNKEYNNKWFYAFVTKLEYENQNVTYVHFKLDVFQTWLFDMNFKPSFVIREHCKLWNSDGTPVINTVDEGLNYGTDYDVVTTARFMPTGAYKWLVIVSKTPLESGNNRISSSIIGTPQPLHYYAVAYRDDDSTPNVVIEKTGSGLPSLGKPSKVLEAIYTNIENANDIVSVYVTDYIGVECTYSDNTITFPNNSNDISYVAVDLNGENFTILHFKKVTSFKPEYKDVFTNKYSGFRPVTESKLLMYPYTVLVATDFKGNQTEFKLEFINDTKVRVAYKGSLGTSNFVTINIPSYNRLEGDAQRVQTSNEHALIDNSPNDVPILTDMLAAFLQGNRNSIQNQKNSIVFNGVMGGINSGLSAGASALSGNPFGVASSITEGIQGAGNTVLQLQSIEAKQKDISNVPPQIAKMGSNTAYNYGNDYNGVYFLKKQIKPEYITKLTDFFNMYGYKVNEVKIPNFHTRRYWNYVQTSSCVITGNFNNEDMRELKSVFDNGITLWHTDDVGNYSLNNEVI